jgi:hypothetical protein
MKNILPSLSDFVFRIIKIPTSQASVKEASVFIGKYYQMTELV